MKNYQNGGGAIVSNLQSVHNVNTTLGHLEKSEALPLSSENLQSSFEEVIMFKLKK